MDYRARSSCGMGRKLMEPAPRMYDNRRGPTPSFNHNWTDLHSAASQGKVRRIQEIMHKSGPVDLNKKDYYGKTPLYWAAFKGHLACMEELLKFGAEVNTRCPRGGTPLHAVARSYPDCTLLLLKHGAEANCPDKEGVTPMYLAACNGQVDIIRYLIAAGAHLTFRNKSGHIAKGLEQHAEFCQELALLSRTPRSLCHLCRLVVRRCLGEGPIAKVQRLKLPPRLQDYITLTTLWPI